MLSWFFIVEYVKSFRRINRNISGLDLRDSYLPFPLNDLFFARNLFLDE